MEISIELKSKLFAPYLGKTIQYPNDYNFTMRGIHIDGTWVSEEGNFGHFKSSDKLILKPISNITNEDCLHIYDILGWGEKSKTMHSFYGREKMIVVLTKNEFKFTFKTAGLIYQYLQSRGYDIPQYELGGKTLQEAGLVIYK